MCTRKDALKTIVSNQQGHGKIESLQQEIGKELFSQFCSLGYIHEIIPSGSNQDPVWWERTRLADDDYKFYDPEFNPESRPKLIQVKIVHFESPTFAKGFFAKRARNSNQLYRKNNKSSLSGGYKVATAMNNVLTASKEAAQTFKEISLGVTSGKYKGSI